MSRSKKIAIIGSGVAGLASAVRLSKQGHKVTVFERSSVLGGKMGVYDEDGYRFDTGPSLFTQPYLMDQVLSELDPVDFTYFQLEASCKYFWEDGSVFTAFADPTALKNELNVKFSAEAGLFERRLAKSKSLYDSVGRIFIEKPLNKFKTWLSFDVLKAFSRITTFNLNQNMHAENVREFQDPKLVQLFDRFATYNGSDPFKAPALLNMIPHLEFNEGTYFPEGGLRAIPEALIEAGKQLGVNYFTDQGVKEIIIENKRVKGVRTSDKLLDFDIVVSNSDVYPTYKNLLPAIQAPKKILEQERSSSGIIFYWGIKGVFSQLDVHNILFSKDYEEEFNQIFNVGSISSDPTVYINVTSKVQKSDAPEGCENWFVLINAPANRGQDWDDLIKKVRSAILNKIEKILGQNIEPLIEVEKVLDPRSIEGKTSSYQGSLYGTSSNNKFAAFLRHSNDHNRIKGLYFCGGSVHPGGGIPLCLNSAKIVSDLIG